MWYVVVCVAILLQPAVSIAVNGIELSADAQTSFVQGRTKLHDAVQKGDADQIERLIKEGCDPDEEDWDFDRPLWLAVLFNKPQYIPNWIPTFNTKFNTVSGKQQ